MPDELKVVPAKDVLPPAWQGNRRGTRGSWASLIKRITNMTVSEAVEYFGEAARSLDSYKDDLTLRELLVFRAVVETLVDPSPAMLNLFMEREEGRVESNINGEININVLDWRALAEQKGLTEEEVLAEVKLLMEQQIKAIPEVIHAGTTVDAAAGKPESEQPAAVPSPFRFEKYRVEPKADFRHDSE